MLLSCCFVVLFLVFMAVWSLGGFLFFCFGGALFVAVVLL